MAEQNLNFAEARDFQCMQQEARQLVVVSSNVGMRACDDSRLNKMIGRLNLFKNLSKLQSIQTVELGECKYYKSISGIVVPSESVMAVIVCKLLTHTFRKITPYFTI